mmetsp:Transcript_18424/g.32679  ORF Transcript_18424/g.32679 Transcript_18424/m.32679 type:complete len:240 (-) Transcript_18424:273-992(-)
MGWMATASARVASARAASARGKTTRARARVKTRAARTRAKVPALSLDLSDQTACPATSASTWLIVAREAWAAWTVAKTARGASLEDRARAAASASQRVTPAADFDQALAVLHSLGLHASSCSSNINSSPRQSRSHNRFLSHSCNSTVSAAAFLAAFQAWASPCPVSWNFQDPASGDHSMAFRVCRAFRACRACRASRDCRGCRVFRVSRVCSLWDWETPPGQHSSRKLSPRRLHGLSAV